MCNVPGAMLAGNASGLLLMGNKHRGMKQDRETQRALKTREEKRKFKQQLDDFLAVINQMTTR